MQSPLRKYTEHLKEALQLKLKNHPEDVSAISDLYQKFVDCNNELQDEREGVVSLNFDSGIQERLQKIIKG